MKKYLLALFVSAFFNNYSYGQYGVFLDKDALQVSKIGTIGTITFHDGDPSGVKTKTSDEKLEAKVLTTDCEKIKDKKVIAIKEGLEFTFAIDCDKKTVVIGYLKSTLNFTYDKELFKQVKDITIPPVVTPPPPATTDLSNQVSVYIENEEIKADSTGSLNKILFYDDNPKTKKLESKFTVDENSFGKDCKKDSVSVSASLSYVLDCNNKEVTIFRGKIIKENFNFKFKYNKDSKVFEFIAKPIEKVVKDIVFFPLNEKRNKDRNKEGSCSILHKKNRVLILDANPSKCHNCDGTGLYKFKKITKESCTIQDGADKKLGEASSNGEKTCSCPRVNAEALPINRYLSVLIENYNFYDLEQFSITMNGENYSYDQDLKKIYEIALAKPTKADNKTDGSSAGTGNDLTERSNGKPLNNYLKRIIDILDTYEYLNLNDLYKLEEYKDNLEIYYNNHKSEFNDKEPFFDEQAKGYLQKIMAWFPKYVSLTPISIDIPDRDEVDISYTMKNKGANAVTKPLGNFKTFGGVSVDYGAAFYQTDLKNQRVYTKTTGTVADNNQDTRAYMSSKDGDSIGFGLNIGLSYRTGIHMRPTFNFGFFVPLEEDITPFIATGPGIGFYSKNYKVNFSWGISLGKVNSIKDEYIEHDPASANVGQSINLSGLNLTNEALTEKVLKTGHYYSISISFNVFK
ncbi:hypothetical protein DMB65_08130 [Flavobacterium cheongpyeongense]|uniref:Uncharacterized protein n=1 Tax=Flavobacterium cheongpyeongense TaxID=2212651 RepID=A0A2V4BUE0_9FLAO|nr:hypothetical protein [Flavobacterium cheongpyeongense]PXY41360.1 hypothetical protein DMB65_08130 [Flavobacterium cheongpyeongense]